MLRIALEQAYFFNLIPYNPADGIQLPVPEHIEQRVMTLREKTRMALIDDQ